MGYSGSGKSTLAEELGKHYFCDVLHFDAVHFYDNWREREKDEQTKIVSEFMDTHSSWIIDGNYSKILFERRLSESDLIIMMHFSRFDCLLRVIKRYIKYRGRTRPDMGKGCEEKLDFEFVRWILFDGRSKAIKERDARVFSEYHDKCIALKTQRDIDKFKESIK